MRYGYTSLFEKFLCFVFVVGETDLSLRVSFFDVAEISFVESKDAKHVGQLEDKLLV